MKRFNIPPLKTFDDWMTFAADLRVERDDRTWLLGYIVHTLCPDRPGGGRPLPDDFTAAKFARMVGEEPSAVSQWRNNYLFWHDRFEDIPDNASWRQCADCRRRSGWRPGMEVTPIHLDHAISFLIGEVDYTRPPDQRPAWQRRLERAAGILSECVEDPEMPDAIRALVRRVLAYVRNVRPDSREKLTA